MNPLDPLQQDEIESQNYLSGHRYNAKLTMIFLVKTMVKIHALN